MIVKLIRYYMGQNVLAPSPLEYYKKQVFLLTPVGYYINNQNTFIGLITSDANV